MFRFREVEKHFDTEKEVTQVVNIAATTIKPETDITVEEAKAFINSLFM